MELVVFAQAELLIFGNIYNVKGQGKEWSQKKFMALFCFGLRTAGKVCEKIMLLQSQKVIIMIMREEHSSSPKCPSIF